METIILTVHLIAITLFVILIAAKTWLMVINKIDQMEKLKKATQIPEAFDIAIGLGTGIYLALQQPPEAQMLNWLQLGLIVLTIPFGLMAFRFHKRIMAPIALFMLFGVVALSFIGLQ